jgi:ribosomal protein L23
MEVLTRKQVILRPVMSEKSLSFYKNNRVCSFWVDTKATKKDIVFSFKETFGVETKAIRTVVYRKNATVRNRKTYASKEVRKYVKKAYITIGEGTIDIFESIK